jgi:heme exporter protein D
MSFQFASLAEFWTMAGHGPYVWACYGVAFIVLAYLLIAPRRAHRQYLKQQRALKVASENLSKAKPSQAK